MVRGGKLAYVALLWLGGTTALMHLRGEMNYVGVAVTLLLLLYMYSDRLEDRVESIRGN